MWRTRAMLGALCALAVGPLALGAPPLTYPAAPRGGDVDDYHGTRVGDPYRWLEKLDDARTAAWLREEKKLTEVSLRRIAGRDAVKRRLDALSLSSRTHVPWREGGRLFFLRSGGRDPQPVLMMQDAPAEPARVVLDPSTISRDGSVEVGDYAVSPDGRLLAYRASRGGADVGDVHLLELATGREAADVVQGTITNVFWTRDARGFFYV